MRTLESLGLARKLHLTFRLLVPPALVFLSLLLSFMFLFLLPLKLYLVFFYQVILVNRTKMICSDFKRPSEVLPGSACCTISHVHTPWWDCNKCSSMIVSTKDLVS